jgi:hypothetical protein
MDVQGLKLKIWYGSEDVQEIQKAMGKKYLVWTEQNRQFLYIRPNTPRNKEIMQRDMDKTEADIVKEQGRA